MQAAGIIPALLQAASMVSCPESPVWLDMAHQPDEAQKVREQLLGPAAFKEPGSTDTQPPNGLEDPLLSSDDLPESEDERAGNWRDLLRKRYAKAMVLALGLPIFQQLSGISSVTFYCSQVFQDAGLTSPVLSSIGVGVVFVVGTGLAAGLMDHAGRRPLLLYSHLAMGICLLVTAAAQLLSGDKHTAGIITLGSIVVYVFSFSLGTGPIPTAYVAEILPGRIKGRAQATCMCFGWLTNLGIGLTFPYMLAHLGVGGAYAVYAGLNAVAAAFVAVLMNNPDSTNAPGNGLPGSASGPTSSTGANSLAPARSSGNPCLADIDYTVAIGQTPTTGNLQAFGQIPVFVGSLLVTSYAEDPIEEWRMGWNFTTGERINAPGDLTSYRPDLELVAFNHSNTELEAGPDANTSSYILPRKPYAISFVGTKATGSQKTQIQTNDSPYSPFLVGPVTNLAFNNLMCSSSQGETAESPPPPMMKQQVEQRAVQSKNAIFAPRSLFVEYAPITFRQLPFGVLASSFTQFFVRVTNLLGPSPVPVETITFQYWFDGPTVEEPNTSPDELFTVVCTDANLGCDNLILNITEGKPGVAGARYTLTVGFEAIGSLQSASRPSNNTSQRNFRTLEVLLRIQTLQFLEELDGEADFSYINTTITSSSTNTTIVPRQAIPNAKIPSFINDQVVWGGVPDAETVNGGAASAPAPSSSNSLPPSVTCNEISAGLQACWLSLTYCCYAPAGQQLNTSIPAEFPPPAIPEPAALLEGQVQCKSGNCSLTPAGTSPSPLPPPPTAISPPPGPPSQPAQAPVPAAAGAVQPSAQSSSSGIGTGAIVGIAVGAAVGLLALLVALGLFVARHRRRRGGQDGGKGKPGRPWSVGRPSRKFQGDSDPLRAAANPLLNRRAPPSVKTYRGPQGGTLYHANSSMSEAAIQEELAAMYASPFDAAASHQHSVQGMPGLDRPSLIASLALMERRAASMPSMGSSGLETITESDEEGHGYGSPIWTRPVHKANSWSGIVVPVGAPAKVAPRHRRMPSTIAAGLPPLMSLGEPVTFTSPHAAGIDLNIDFETEIKPFIGRKLGSGGFGTVFCATWRGREVAVKRLPPPNENDSLAAHTAAYQALLQEIELASKFNSERLVRVLGACMADRHNICLVMELVPGGNLFHRIHASDRRMSYMEILQLAHDVAQGLAYLHPSVVHRDLKPSNIMLDRNGRAKIADFGISRMKDPSKTFLTTTNVNQGTAMYMAPEQFNGTRLDEKVDVYALGCIMNECFTRRQPWNEYSIFFQIIVQVAIKQERPKIDADTPEDLKRLIQKCWHPDPRVRPSCAEIMRLSEILLHQEHKKELRWAESQAKLSNRQLNGPAGSSSLSRAGSASSPRLAPGFLSPRHQANHTRRPSGGGLASAASGFRASPLGATPPGHGPQASPCGLNPAASGLVPAASGLGPAVSGSSSSPGGPRPAASGLGSAASGSGFRATEASQASDGASYMERSLSRAGSGSSGLGPSRAFVATLTSQRSSGSGSLFPTTQEPVKAPFNRKESSGVSSPVWDSLPGSDSLLSSDASGDHVIHPESSFYAGGPSPSLAPSSNPKGHMQQDESKTHSGESLHNSVTFPTSIPSGYLSLPMSGDGGDTHHRWGDSVIDSASLDAVVAPSSVTSLPSLVRTSSLDGPAHLTDDWTFAIQPPLGSSGKRRQLHSAGLPAAHSALSSAAALSAAAQPASPLAGASGKVAAAAPTRLPRRIQLTSPMQQGSASSGSSSQKSQSPAWSPTQSLPQTGFSPPARPGTPTTAILSPPLPHNFTANAASANRGMIGFGSSGSRSSGDSRTLSPPRKPRRSSSATRIASLLTAGPTSLPSRNYRNSDSMPGNPSSLGQEAWHGFTAWQGAS
ncbi:hypothetical protein WJX74_003381 [Apatococcus lobatus]|uniref:Uncharacterized protein n=1 Tax=Apatococcus lobatus TaxID=904363 RepID=A0AAW1R1T0_9CHLO